MEPIETVCALCKRVDRGNGVWSSPTHQPAAEHRTGLCSDCCHQRFPQFYSDYEKPVRHQ